ncbi:hypothetical protein, partial [Acinetobacter sp. OIFC021]|uniref:hypothetical protein n=1 Tax=Acinetobacter sp. OIFC021 TaxID=903928 RepID=UPI001BB20651
AKVVTPPKIDPTIDQVSFKALEEPLKSKIIHVRANTKIKDTKEIAIIFPIKLFIFKIFTFIKYF